MSRQTLLFLHTIPPGGEGGERKGRGRGEEGREGERGSEKGGKRGGEGRIKEVMKSCCFVFHTAKKAVTLAAPPPT